ncbi:MAG: serine/threonine-protein kinase [Polyangiaceae bacterium]
MPSQSVVKAAKAMVGRVVRGKWHLDALLGVGGSAAVYAATHRNGSRGALKILRRDLAGDREIRERFLREGEIANRVAHPGAVAMIDDDVADDGSPFLVMELLTGTTLEDFLRKKRQMPLREALRIIESLLDVVAAAHLQGVVHGDIKPANVMITSTGAVKLLDFGIARVSNGDTQVMGEALGTPAYMSPEQARGDEVDGRADLWSIGALLFALLSGRRPRQGKSPGAEIVMAASDPMPRLGEVVPSMGYEIADVVDRALAFDRTQRWPDATTMQQAVRLALLLEQATGPAERGVHVPVAAARDEAPTLVDVFVWKPGDAKRFGLATPSTITADIRGDGSSVSSLPPGPTTGHRLAFAASTPPPVMNRQPSRLTRSLVASALVIVGLGLGLAFTMTGPMESALGGGAPANGADAGPDATLR